MSNTDAAMLALAERCRTASSLAAARGYAPPAQYVAASRIVAEATRVANEPAPAPPAPPTDPKKVAEWCDAYAAARVAHRERAVVAADLVDRSNRAAMRAIVEEVPTWLAAVVDEFDEEVAEFEQLVATAPHSVTSAMSGEEFVEHARLLRAAERLTQSALARGQFGMVVDEGDQIGREGAMWLILDPKPEATLQEASQALKDHAGAFPSGIEAWARVATIGLRMARGGEVGQRRERFATLLNAGGNSVDGGMRDKSFAEAGGMVR